jgi:hypothetical protein
MQRIPRLLRSRAAWGYCSCNIRVMIDRTCVFTRSALGIPVRYRIRPYRIRWRRGACSGASQPMLRPNGAHLFIGRKLAALGLRESFVKRSLFLSSQWNHRFIVTGQLQEDTCKDAGRGQFHDPQSETPKKWSIRTDVPPLGSDRGPNGLKSFFFSTGREFFLGGYSGRCQQQSGDGDAAGAVEQLADFIARLWNPVVGGSSAHADSVTHRLARRWSPSLTVRSMPRQRRRSSRAIK